MLTFLSVGRWTFPIPFAILGLMHFMNTESMAEKLPWYLPAHILLVYLSGAGLLAAALSMLTGKYDKLAAAVLSILLLLFAFLLHLPGAMDGNEATMSNLLKDLGLSAASMIYATHIAKDHSIVG